MRITNQSAVIGALVLAVLGAGVSSGVAAQQQVWNESEVVEALGLQRTKSGLSHFFTTGDGVECAVAVVMTTGGAVRMYESAGDVVATNPGKTAGVKISARETRTCLEAATKLLEKLR